MKISKNLGPQYIRTQFLSLTQYVRLKSDIWEILFGSAILAFKKKLLYLFYRVLFTNPGKKSLRSRFFEMSTIEFWVSWVRCYTSSTWVSKTNKYDRSLIHTRKQNFHRDSNSFLSDSKTFKTFNQHSTNYTTTLYVRIVIMLPHNRPHLSSDAHQAWTKFWPKIFGPNQAY